MYIKYLSKMILEEETSECSLKDCSVVIDGHNIVYNIYEKVKLPFVFGCEADQYARLLRRLCLKKFHKANIKCYIVLKGGDADINKKIEKYKTTNFDFECNNKFVPPVLLNDIFKQLLDEMGIDYTICVTETKNEIVALAQKLGCPLISFDVEYCFKNALYVPINTTKFDDTTNSIQCRQFRLQDFLQKHSLTEEKLALFATLTDFNLFPEDYFDSLLQTWGVIEDEYSDTLRKLIAWLSKHSEDEAREGISKCILNDDDKMKFEVYYDDLKKNMRHCEAGIASNYLFNSGVGIERCDPRWFEKGVVSKEIAVTYINLYKWKVLQGSQAIENKNSDDSVLLSIDIIKYAYNLLTNFKTDNIKLYQNADTYVVINTEDRNISKPRYSCRESVFENGWRDLKRLKLFEHFLNENQIISKELERVPVETTVLFAALVYFARKKLLNNIDVTREVYAVLISYVMVNIVLDEEASYKKRRSGICEEDCPEAVRVTEKYFKYDDDEAERIFDGNLLKSLAELQYCMMHMNYLNTLCGSTYKSTRFHRTYNATFIYQLICDMPEDNIDFFIDELFERSPSVLNFIRTLTTFYQNLL